MKKFLSLLILAAAGMSQAQAGFSIGISIGDHHRHQPPVVVHRPPVVVHRPPVVVVPAPVYGSPCDHERGYAYGRRCEHYDHRRHSHGHDRYEGRRDQRSRWGR